MFWFPYPLKQFRCSYSKIVCLAKLTKCKGLNSSIFSFIEILYIVKKEISFKENTKDITKFLKLSKNANYVKKISTS